MKLSVLQQQNCNNRRNNSFRSTAPLDASVDGFFKSPVAFFWLILHGLCCLISLVLGFRFSRLIFFLLFSTASNNNSPPYSATHHLLHSSQALALQPPPSTPLQFDTGTQHNRSRVVVGRHGIRIRPWPHPNPTEVMKAHRIIKRVQKEQRLQYGIKNPRTLLVVTPTYTRTFQTLHLTGLMHTLMLVPYDLVWIVIEAGGVSNDTASILAKSRLQVLHLPFDERMPGEWEARHRIEARMRLHALRAVREKKLDGILMFADDSNMHSMDLFDGIQSVKWFGAVSVGILALSNTHSNVKLEGEDQNLPLPVQGPACNSSGQLAGWHTFNSLPYVEKSAMYVDDGATVLPRKLEWAGFVLNSRLVWKEAEGKPDWVSDLDEFNDGDDLDSPLVLLKDTSFVEPLGKCGRKVLLWWFRVEARADSKFPSGWVIDPPLDITIPAKRTPWPDASLELVSTVKATVALDRTEKHHRKTRRSRQSSHSKRKHETQVEAQVSGVSGRHSEEK